MSADFECTVLCGRRPTSHSPAAYVVIIMVIILVLLLEEIYYIIKYYVYAFSTEYFVFSILLIEDISKIKIITKEMSIDPPLSLFHQMMLKNLLKSQAKKYIIEKIYI